MEEIGGREQSEGRKEWSKHAMGSKEDCGEGLRVGKGEGGWTNEGGNRGRGWSQHARGVGRLLGGLYIQSRILYNKRSGG